MSIKSSIEIFDVGLKIFDNLNSKSGLEVFEFDQDTLINCFRVLT